jgi:hypothetical protein
VTCVLRRVVFTLPRLVVQRGLKNSHYSQNFVIRVGERLIFVLRSLLRDSSAMVDYRLDSISKFGPQATVFGNFYKIVKNLRIYSTSTKRGIS